MEASEHLVKSTNLLLEIASLLMVSGANTIRVNQNIKRFSDGLNYNASFFISHKSIIMTLYTKDDSESCTRVKNIPAHAINFSLISAFSKASWQAREENWTLEQISAEVQTIKKIERYPNIVILIAVSLAGAGFCNIFKGDYINMAVAFVATFIGLTVFRWSHHKNFNVYIRIFMGSFVATMIASLGILFNIGSNPQTALATSILYLVPGVSLINSFTDFLDNNIINGLVRFANGLMIVLAMALGLFITMLIFKLH